jgi:PKD repeat protein
VPAGASISTRRLASNVTNRIAGADRSAFTYYPSAASLTTITSVGINIFVDASTQQPPDETQLRSSAFLRNQNQAPIASFSATPTGDGHVLLNGGSSSDGDGTPLSFVWSNVTGGGNVTIGTAAVLDWHPGAGTYSVKLTVTDPGGLAGTQTQAVTVQ